VACLKNLTPKEKALFFNQFASLLNSGMTIQQSLNLVEKNPNSAFGRYLQKVIAAVVAGQDLASAMAVDAHYFDGWTISLIRLATYSGSLPGTFRRLAIAAERQQRCQRLYRSVNLAAIILIWSALLLVVAIFKTHPSGFIRLGFWLNAIGLALLLIAVSLLSSRYPGRGLQRLIAKFPGMSKVTQAQSLLYLGEMELPLSCGVSVLAALDLVRDRIPDPTMAANLANVARKVRTGQTLTESFQGKIPPIAVQMIRTGEETGNLDAALQQLSAYYEGELERSLRQLKGILRPLNFLGIGSVIAVISIRLLSLLTNSLPG
jgi:type II secretory pathway component PulF